MKIALESDQYYRFYADGGSYRYTFNGQEQDNELNDAAGTSLTAEYWQYDSRLGRRWNVDPVAHFWLAGYAVLANNPTNFTDPDGQDLIFHLHDLLQKDKDESMATLKSSFDQMFNGKVDVNYVAFGEGDYIRISSISVKKDRSESGGLEERSLNAHEQVKYYYIQTLIQSPTRYYGAIGVDFYSEDSKIFLDDKGKEDTGDQPFAYNVYSYYGQHCVRDMCKYQFMINANMLKYPTKEIDSGNMLFLVLTGLRNNGQVNLTKFNQGTGLNAVEANMKRRGPFDLILKSSGDINIGPWTFTHAVYYQHRTTYGFSKYSRLTNQNKLRKKYGRK